MWTYEQKTGHLQLDGALVAVGYSGHGAGKNNPDMQAVHNVGPLPQGFYEIGTPRDTESHGPYVLPLTPDHETDCWGRSGFLVHGDSIKSPGSASHGCIIVARNIREKIWKSNDHKLQVVSGVYSTENG